MGEKTIKVCDNCGKELKRPFGSSGHPSGWKVDRIIFQGIDRVHDGYDRWETIKERFELCENCKDRAVDSFDRIATALEKLVWEGRDGRRSEDKSGNAIEGGS